VPSLIQAIQDRRKDIVKMNVQTLTRDGGVHPRSRIGQARDVAVLFTMRRRTPKVCGLDESSGLQRRQASESRRRSHAFAQSQSS
jgi:hypothetical protein